MESIGIDARLKALVPIVDELKELRAYLEEAARGRSDGITFEPEIRAIDQALSRIEPHVHAHKWPPVWWRLSGMNIDAVPRFFHRVDSEGAYFDRSRPNIEGAYIPERERILQVADRINGMYKAMSGVR